MRMFVASDRRHLGFGFASLGPRVVRPCGQRCQHLGLRRSLRSFAFGDTVAPNSSFKPTPLRGAA